jgi:hypothetical protein
LNITETLVGHFFSNAEHLKIDADFPQGSLYLVANQKEFTKVQNNNLGFYLYLVNATTKEVKLDTIDKSLYIIMEVLDANNEWAPISCLPWSTCGNSYYPIRLNSNEYLKTNVPVFEGEFKTKLRFVLRINKDEEICSNEIETSINLSQLKHEKLLELKDSENLITIIGDDSIIKKLRNANSPKVDADKDLTPISK